MAVDLRALPRDPEKLFSLHDVVGTGTYGEVFKADDNKTNKPVAVKIMDLVEDEEDEIRVEVEVLKKCGSHENITSFIGAFLTKEIEETRAKDKLWIVMEFCGGGSVTDLAVALKPKHIPADVLQFIMHETLAALLYLHKCCVIHRDLKGQNVLMCADGRVKLVDFGVSANMKNSKEMRNTFIGTPYWMAPEVIACDSQIENLYDMRSDVWSLGITAIEMFDSQPPLSDIHPMRALFLIPRNPPPTVADKKGASKEFISFVGECLIKDFERRPGAKKMATHPFVKAMESPSARSGAQDALAGLIVKARKASDKVSAPTKSFYRKKTAGRGSDDSIAVNVTGADGGLDLPTGNPNAQPGAVLNLTKSHRRKRNLQAQAQAKAVSGLAGIDSAAGGDGSANVGNSHQDMLMIPKVGGEQPSFMDRLMSKEEREALPQATMVVRKKNKSGGDAQAAGVRGPNELPRFEGIDGEATAAAMKMPEIRKFKKKFNSEIMDATFWGANLLVALRNGLVFLDRTGDGKVFPLIQKRGFKQIDVIESLGVMVAICGKHDKLRVYNLNYFKGQILGNLDEDEILYTSLTEMDACIHYNIAKFDRMKFLCAATPMKVSVYLWAPNPYNKFMVFKEFIVQHQPQQVSMKIDEEENLRLVFASLTGFHAIDVDSGAVLNLHVPMPQPKTGINPIAIIQLPLEHSAEYLLCYDDKAVCVDAYGDVATRVTTNWADPPTNIAYAYPSQALGWTSMAIEVRSIVTGELQGVFKHKKATKLRFLCARNNKVFFASITQGASQVYFMVF
eukprot:m.482487 g.482487  ORF g.482487 m.482487 type:complete len:791 (-) comp22555_c0_seq1:1286-3658(-)